MNNTCTVSQSISSFNKSVTDRNIKKIGETHLNAKISALTELAEEIDSEGYLTAERIKVAIKINLRILNEVREYNEKDGV